MKADVLSERLRKLFSSSIRKALKMPPGKRLYAWRRILEGDLALEELEFVVKVLERIISALPNSEDDEKFASVPYMSEALLRVIMASGIKLVDFLPVFEPPPARSSFPHMWRSPGPHSHEKFDPTDSPTLAVYKAMVETCTRGLLHNEGLRHLIQ